MEMRSRTTAKVVGSLFIVATVAGAAGAALLAPLDDPDSLVGVSALRQRTALGSLLISVMAVAIAMIPAAMFPILGKFSRAHALGYAVARTVEAVTVLPAAVGPLLITALSAEYARAGAPEDGAHFETLRTLLLESYTRTLPVSTMFFCLSVVLLNYLLYRGGLVPRWISAWALAAVVPYLTGGLLVLFELISTTSPLYAALVVPLAVNEMVLAVWLLAKGFTGSELMTDR